MRNASKVSLLPRILTAALAVPGIAEAAREYNLQPPVTPVARQMYDLHAFIFWICVAIFVVVFAVMFYSIFRHRKSIGHQAAHFHESTTVEIIWTVIPFLILLFMAFPATKTILAMKDTSAPDMTIKVTGFQWKWNYDYLQEGFGFYSNLSTPLAQIEGREPKGENYLLEVDNPLVVPVDTKVRLLITAGDVLHAWWLPAFGVKQDAIPGFVRDTWFRAEKVGIYRGQCAELCGKEHGFMPIVVDVKSKEDYAKWAAGRRRDSPRPRPTPTKSGSAPSSSRAARSSTRPTARRATRQTAKGVAGSFPALDGSKIVNGPKDAQIAIVLQRQAGHGDAALDAALRHRSRVGDHVHPQQLEQQDRRGGAAFRHQSRAQIALDRIALETSR